MEPSTLGVEANRTAEFGISGSTSGKDPQGWRWIQKLFEVYSEFRLGEEYRALSFPFVLSMSQLNFGPSITAMVDWQVRRVATPRELFSFAKDAVGDRESHPVGLVRFAPANMAAKGRPESPSRKFVGYPSFGPETTVWAQICTSKCTSTLNSDGVV